MEARGEETNTDWSLFPILYTLVSTFCYRHTFSPGFKMSVPSPYTQRSSPGEERCRVIPTKSEKKEDCRDFLRTGRCKYGASCKYNHPANVQSGGGMKTPIDPSEPLYPIRYNEPVCQYYMKHGTCKFGQACKFHHPPQITGPSNVMNGNNAMLMGAPMGGRKEDGGPHSGAMWKAGNDPGVQVLPQRPDEPNCIYFLKNGRCKYGATCRYHHPLKYHQDNGRSRNGFEDGRNTSNHGRQSLDQRNGPKVHYVTALPPGSMQQGHFVVADGTVTFLSLDGNAPAHVVSIAQSPGTGGKEYPAEGTIATSTSSTSIASSFETSGTNVDPTNEASNGALWNNRKANGGSMGSAYNLPRVVSTSSAHSEGGGYYDANSGPQAWRRPHSASFDHTRVRSASHSNHEEMVRSTSVQSALDERGVRRPRSASTTSSMIRGSNMHHRDNVNSMRPQPLRGEVDDGLSMMTSALLTMLDTPNEDGGATQQSETYDNDRLFPATSRLDDQGLSMPATSMNRGAPAPPDDYSRDYYNEPSAQYGQPQRYGQGNFANDEHPSELTTPNAVRGNLNDYGGQPEGPHMFNQMSRIQSWLGSAAAGVIHEDSQFSSMNSSQQLPSTNPNTSTNVGLYY